VARDEEGGDGEGVGRGGGWIEGFFCPWGDIHANVVIAGEFYGIARVIIDRACARA
jgi:hypothetical protein